MQEQKPAADPKQRQQQEFNKKDQLVANAQRGILQISHNELFAEVTNEDEYDDFENEEEESINQMPYNLRENEQKLLQGVHPNSGGGLQYDEKMMSASLGKEQFRDQFNYDQNGINQNYMNDNMIQQMQYPVNPQGNNVYQNFNQPQVVNFTANAFYQSPYNQQQQIHHNAALPQIRYGKQNESPQGRKKKSQRPISAFNDQDDKHQRLSQMQQPYLFAQKKTQVTMNDFMNSTYRKKLIPVQMLYNKEDLYDQNISLKLNLNDFKDDNTMLRTRLSQMINQLKGRDKLIDELYKTAFITAAGTQAKNNLNKDIHLLINLKRQVQDLKDTIYSKENENMDLKKNLKSTKIKELETDLKQYMTECLRLRAITERAIKMSGEIDLKRIQQQQREQAVLYQQNMEKFDEQMQDKDNEYQKLQNSYQQSQLDIKNQDQKLQFFEEKVNTLNNEIEALEKDRARKLADKEKEIQNLNSMIQQSEQQCQNLRQQLTDTQKNLKKVEAMIPKRPEKEYIQEIDQKNDKLQELMDELLQKDTLIDQQAVLNKTMQKKVDAANEEIKGLKQKLQESQTKVSEQESNIKQLTREIERQIRENQQQTEELDQQAKDTKAQLEDKIKKQQQDFANVTSENNQLKMQLDSSRGREKSLQEKQLQSEAQFEELKQLQQQQAKKIKKSAREEIKIEQPVQEQPNQEQRHNSQIGDDEDEQEVLTDNKSLLEQNLLEGELELTSQKRKEIQQIVQQTELILQNLAQHLAQKQSTLRKNFEDKIYTVRLIENDVEVEVLRIDDFINFVSQSTETPLTSTQQVFMSRVFSIKSPNPEGCILLEHVSLVLRNFGIRDDFPRSKKHLNYENLNLQSKRVLNRLLNYLQENNQTIEDFVKDLISMQTVKTKTTTEKVEILRADQFFKKLWSSEIIIQYKIQDNLCRFLCIDEQYKNHLMYKKIKRALTDFENSQALQSIGLKKRKFLAEEAQEKQVEEEKEEQDYEDNSLIQKQNRKQSSSDKQSQSSGKKSSSSGKKSSSSGKKSSSSDQKHSIYSKKDSIHDHKQSSSSHHQKDESLIQKKDQSYSEYKEPSSISQIKKNDQSDDENQYELEKIKSEVKDLDEQIKQSLNFQLPADINNFQQELEEESKELSIARDSKQQPKILHQEGTLNVGTQEEEESQNDYDAEVEEDDEEDSEDGQENEQRSDSHNLEASPNVQEPTVQTIQQPQNRRVNTDDIFKLDNSDNIDHEEHKAEGFDPYNPFGNVENVEEDPNKEESYYYEEEYGAEDPNDNQEEQF